MNFLIDENIPVAVASWLTDRGHTTSFVPKGTSDDKIGAIARERRVVLLTQDRHFANTLRFPPKNFFGIIRLKIHPAFIPDITSSLESFLSALPAANALTGKLVILGKDGFFKLK